MSQRTASEGHVAFPEAGDDASLRQGQEGLSPTVSQNGERTGPTDLGVAVPSVLACCLDICAGLEEGVRQRKAYFQQSASRRITDAHKVARAGQDRDKDFRLLVDGL